MDELVEFCQRVLGVGPEATAAARAARATGVSGRVELLALASRECRERSQPSTDAAPLAIGNSSEGLAAAVARELAIAVGRLPERHREALALREHVQLSHAEMGQVMGLGASAVAPLLARARLRLREERRGVSAPPAPVCEQRDQALRALTQRQDREPLGSSERTWLADHLAACQACGQAHAAMLEASVCYRAWALNGGEEQEVVAVSAPAAAPIEAPPDPEPVAAVVEPDPLPAVVAPEPPLPEAVVPAPPAHYAQAPEPQPEPEPTGWWRRLRAALAADARR